MEINQCELKQFARAIKRLEALEKSTQRQIIWLLQGEGLSLEKCVTIAQNYNQQESFTLAQMLDKDHQKVKRILYKIKQILQKEPDKKRRVIQDQGLKVERFNQIVQFILHNPHLQRQVQRL